VSWNPSTGASNYNVARDGVYLGPTGNVTSYVDTGANPPVITPGTAIASDGTSNVNVSVSLSGTSVANGTIHTYAVMAINASGNSTLSPAVGGYRGHGALTYQWQISAGDSDANYSDIGGATSSTYTNTSTPSNVGRYWRCVLNATGATQQISLADRGYRSNTPFKGVANSLLALILLVVGIFVIFKVFAKKRRERNKSS
jgi:hypothetical protein